MGRPPTDLKHRLINAARGAFDRRGVDAVSLRAIARAARTTIGMVYYYYPSRDELLGDLVDRHNRRLWAICDEARESHRT